MYEMKFNSSLADNERRPGRSPGFMNGVVGEPRHPAILPKYRMRNIAPQGTTGFQCLFRTVLEKTLCLAGVIVN